MAGTNTCPNEVNTGDTSQTLIKYIRELCWGEFPTTPQGANASQKKMKTLRFTGEGLMVDKATTVSEEIRADRQISDLIPTKFSASGDFNGELSLDTYKEFMLGAMCNEWATVPAKTCAETQVMAGSIIVIKPGTPPPALIVGQAVVLSGFSAVENNVTVVVKELKSEGRSIRVEPALKVVAAPGEAVTFSGAEVISNGVEDVSFMFEKEFTDIESIPDADNNKKSIMQYFGMTVDKMTLNMEAEAKAGVTFSFMGKTGATAKKSASSVAPTPATSTSIMSSSVQEGLSLEGGKSTGLIKSVSLDLGNTLRGKPAVGEKGNIGIGKGRVVVTGNLSAYFKDFSIYQKYLTNEDTSLVFSLGDEVRGFYVLHMPKIKLTETKIAAGGPDQDVMADGGYQALHDPITKKTLIITRIAGTAPEAP